jgi:hypothetical protein
MNFDVEKLKELLAEKTERLAYWESRCRTAEAELGQLEVSNGELIKQNAALAAELEGRSGSVPPGAYELADALYTAGYDAKGARDYDPRGCNEWQPVVNELCKPSPPVAVPDGGVLLSKKSIDLIRANHVPIEFHNRFDAFINAIQQQNSIDLSTPTPPSAEQSKINSIECQEDIYKNGVSVGIFDMGKEYADELCSRLTELTEYRYDWHYIAGRVHIKLISKASVEQPDSAAFKITDAEINSITEDALGKWPTFQMQSWACKVVHAVLVKYPPCNGKLQRIAEQDAREIIEKYNDWKEHESFRDFSVEQFFKEDASKVLLAKLNEHCEPDYKAQRDLLLRNLKSIVDIDCPLIGSPSSNDLIEFWQKEHHEGRGIAETMLDALRAIDQCEGGE